MDKQAAIETEALDDFLSDLDDLGQGELLALDAAWRGADPIARRTAWLGASRAAQKHGLAREIEAVCDQTMHWATRGDNRPPLYHIVGDDIGWLRLRTAAAPALVDAAVAIAMAPYLNERDREILLEPWDCVMAAVPRRR